MSRAWTMDEYVTRFRLSKGLRELLAEAETDSQFFRWFLHAEGKDVQVLASHHVKDDRERIEALGLRPGAKGKCLAVAVGLAAAGVGNEACVVVDADDDGIASAPPSHALATDYPSLESYALDAEVLDDVIARVFARSHVMTGQDLIDLLDPLLRWLTAARRWARRQAPSIALTDSWATKVNFDRAPLTWDAAEVLRLTLTAAELPATKESVKACAAEVEALVDPDSQLCAQVRGHDFTEALLRVMRGRHLRAKGIDTRKWDRDQLEGVLRMSLNTAYLHRFPLFNELATRWA